MMKRGDIFYADLSPVVGSEQGGVRPVVIIQNNKGNLFSPTLIVAPITKKISRKRQPTQVKIFVPQGERQVPSLILLEQIRTLDKERILHKVGHLTEKELKKVDVALQISVGL